MQMTRFVERLFYTEQEEEAEEWIKAYTDVKRKVMAQASVAPASSALADSTSGSSGLFDFINFLRVLIILCLLWLQSSRISVH